MTKSIVKKNLNFDFNIFGYQNFQSNKVGSRVSQSVKPGPLARDPAKSWKETDQSE